MSVELIPLPPPLPPNVTPMPSPQATAREDALSKLLQNPLVIAGGAVVAGVVLTRLIAAAPARHLIQQAVERALNKNRQSEPTSRPETFLQKGLENMKPQLQGLAEKVINGLLSKKR